MRILILLIAVFAIYLGLTGKGRAFFSALAGQAAYTTGAGGGGSSGFQ